MTLMAKAPEAIYSKFIEIIDKYEKGDLKGQKTQTTDAQGGLKEAKVYYFRHINSMEEEAAHAVLDLVLSGDMKLTSLEKKSREVETLMKIKSAFMGELNRMGESFTMWKEVVDRFPKHTGDDQLTNMFGQEWSLDDLKDVMVWVTSTANQAGQKCFCLVILCSMKEVEEVADMVGQYTLYPSVHKAYYHVENTSTSNGMLTPSVYGMVVATRGTSSSEWKWRSGSKLNFISVKADSPFVDSDGLVVDPRQKPSDLYREVMQAATLQQEWVLFLCCGVGSGVLACLEMQRNCVAAETNEIMLDHLRGQFFKSSGMSGNKSSQSVRPSSPDETSDSGEETEGDIDEEESICSGDDTQMEPVNRKEKGLDTDAPESEDDAQ